MNISPEEIREYDNLSSSGSHDTTARNVTWQNGSCTMPGSENGSHKETSKAASSSLGPSHETAACNASGTTTKPLLFSPKEEYRFMHSSSDNSTSVQPVVLFHVEIANKRIENIPLRTDCQLAHVGEVIGGNESVKVVYYLYEKLQKKEACGIEDAQVMVRLRPNWKCIHLNDLVDDTSATLEEVFGEMLVNNNITLCLVPPERCASREKSRLDASAECEMKQKFKDLFSCFTIEELVDSHCPFSMDFLLDVYRERYSCLSSLSSEEYKHFTDWIAAFRTTKVKSDHQNNAKKEAPPMRKNNSKPSPSSKPETDNSQPLARLRAIFDPATETPLLNAWFEEDQRPENAKISRYTVELNAVGSKKRTLPLEEKSVRIWFKNARAKISRMNLREQKWE